MTGKVNVDYEDVKTVMTSSGVAIMGMAEAEGEDRSLRAAQEALASPLLNDSDIKGAKFVLLNITHGTREVLMDEIDEITDHIQQAAGSSADVIWGYCKDESLGDKVRITVIATGFQTNPAGEIATDRNTRTVIPLSADVPTMITQPILNPVETSAPVAPVAPPAQEEPATPEPYLKPAAAAPVEEARPAPIVAAPQRTIEFEVERAAVAREQQNNATTSAPTPAAPERKVFELYDSTTADQPTDAVDTGRTEINEARWSQAEHQSRVEQRVAKVRELNQRLRTPNGLSDLEREPAYKRKNIHISESTKSTDSNVSRYTLSEETDENGERRVELKRNNPYLHDNVD